MEKQDIKNMSNAELRLYKKSLEDQYEVVKKQINDLYEELDKMDIEYNKVESELNNRQNRKI